jgi:hypothetical protein
VTYLSAEEQQAFAAVTRPVHDKFVDVIGRDLMAKAYAKIEELSR